MKARDAIVAALKNSAEPHALEISSGLIDGSVRIHEEGSPCSCSELRSIYAFRGRNPEAAPSPQARRIKEECVRLAAACARHLEQKCLIVSFEREPNVVFGVFVLTGSFEILGITRAFDRRKTPTSQWKEIWGHE